MDTEKLMVNIKVLDQDIAKKLIKNMKALLKEIEKSNPKDENGMALIHTRAYINLQSMIIMDKESKGYKM